MRSAPFRFERLKMLKQQGVVLFFALVALLAMSLAAVALIRSVDTSTLIAGNLAFKQAATRSGDAGIEAAIGWLEATQLANASLNVFADATHPFNITDTATRPGYHSSIDPTLSLTAATTWVAPKSVTLAPDATGNSVSYIIQRMCRTADAVVPAAGCLYGIDPSNPNPTSIPLPSDICDGTGCPPAGQSPIFRITAKTVGLKNSVSYVQVFVN